MEVKNKQKLIEESLKQAIANVMLEGDVDFKTFLENEEEIKEKILVMGELKHEKLG